jgi:hypothetical protein
MDLIDKKQIQELQDMPIQKLTTDNLSIPEVFKYAINHAYSQGEIKHLLKNSSIDFLEPYMAGMVEKQVIAIEDMPAVFLEDYEIAVEYAKQDIYNMVTLPLHYRDEDDFITHVALDQGEILKYASDRVKSIESVVNIAFKNNKKSFKYFPEEFKTKENCIKALTGNYPDYAYNWQYVPKPLCLDEDFIKEVGAFCPQIFQYIDSSIKDKFEISEYFLSKYANNIRYLSEDNKNNALLISPVLDKYPVYLRFSGESLKNDPEFVFPIIKKEAQIIHDCGEKIKENLEIAKYICQLKVSQPPIGFFNEDIKSNVSIAMLAVLTMPESMNYISKKLSSSENFVGSYIDQYYFNPTALHYIPNELKNNNMLMKKAYDSNTDSLEYVGEQLKIDSEFLTHVFSNINQDKIVPKNKLLTNLKTIYLRLGDEKILLNFCDSSKLDINDGVTKQEILAQIKDSKFLQVLMSQTDLYSYLKSATLMYNLDKNLPGKEAGGKKLKI